MRYDPPLHRTQGLTPLLIALAALIAYPFVFDATYFRHVMILAFVFAIVATSWDLSLGFGGLFNFAHVGLFAVGIYTYAILAKTLGFSPWLSILAGGGTAALVALLIALPVLRLDGIYVILVTIALSQLIYLIVISWSDVTGGTSGMVTLPTLKLGDYRLSKDGRIGYYFVGLALLAGNLAFLYLLTRSRLGRAIRALRDNKYYAIARGVSEARTRALTLMGSAVFTGIAGAYYAAYLRVASPDAFGLGFLTLLLSILLVGGTGTIWGPVVAAFVISVLSEWLSGFGPWQNIVIALAIILIVIFYPGGLWAALQELHVNPSPVRPSGCCRRNMEPSPSLTPKPTNPPCCSGTATPPAKRRFTNISTPFPGHTRSFPSTIRATRSPPTAIPKPPIPSPATPKLPRQFWLIAASPAPMSLAGRWAAMWRSSLQRAATYKSRRWGSPEPRRSTRCRWISDAATIRTPIWCWPANSISRAARPPFTPTAPPPRFPRTLPSCTATCAAPTGGRGFMRLARWG